VDILYFLSLENPVTAQWQKYHIVNELQMHDCYITIFTPIAGQSIKQTNERLIRYVKTHRVDLFMTIHNEHLVYTETIQEIGQQGIPTLLICFDNLVIPYQHKNIASYFDLVWLTSRETEGMFRSWGANTIFQPYAANPQMWNPYFGDDVSRIVFLGSPYGSRVNMINHLLRHGIPVTLYAGSSATRNGESKVNPIVRKTLQDYIGMAKALFRDLQFSIGRRVVYGAILQKTIKRQRLLVDSLNLIREPSISPDRQGEVYSKYAMALSSTAARCTGVLKKPVDIVNLRSFEIPMSGGLQFCRYTDELAEYFENQKEIVFYESDDEMLELAQYYLGSEHTDLRLQIKKAARKRAEGEHTWYIRFRNIFNVLGIHV